MKIMLEPRNPMGIQAYWVGNRQRVATCTSVRLIDEHTLVCASLAGQAMYLVHFDLSSGTYRVIQRIDTVASGAAVCTDLLAFDGKDLLATSNCEDSSVSFYRLAGNRIQYESELRMEGSDGGFCHGVAFVPDSDLICVAIQSGGQSLQLWSRTSGVRVARYVDPHGMPKDAVFVAPKTLLALFSEAASANKMENTFRSKIALVEFSADFRSHSLRGEWLLQESQYDALAHSFGNVFCSSQTHDQVHCYRIGRQIRQTQCFDGYSFPHGLDFDDARGLLAVTNYGDNSIELRVVSPGTG